MLLFFESTADLCTNKRSYFYMNLVQKVQVFAFQYWMVDVHFEFLKISLPLVGEHRNVNHDLDIFDCVLRLVRNLIFRENLLFRFRRARVMTTRKIMTLPRQLEKLVFMEGSRTINSEQLVFSRCSSIFCFSLPIKALTWMCWNGIVLEWNMEEPFLYHRLVASVIILFSFSRQVNVEVLRERGLCMSEETIRSQVWPPSSIIS